jgi:hypothetical protein
VQRKGGNNLAMKEGIPKREGLLTTRRAPARCGGRRALHFGNTLRLDCLLQHNFWAKEIQGMYSQIQDITQVEH